MPRFSRHLALAVCLLAVSLGARTASPIGATASQTISSGVADPAQYVDPFIGTDSYGFTFPGADVPFGMTQWSPDTTTPIGAGYSYTDNTIKGFSLTHLSGSGCLLLQDIPFMPTTNPVNVSPASDPNAYASTFSHDHEQATPGYYGVQLDSGIGVSLTATSRTGMGAFSYPTTTGATMLINTGGSVRGDTDAAAHIVGDDEVTGFATSDSFCGGYTVYFAAVFDHPFHSYGTWNGATITPGATDSVGGASGAYVTFDTTITSTVLAKVGISFVSARNALANLQAENTGWDFAAVQANARSAWNARLGQVEVQGGTPQQTTTFYTALYHTLLHPNVFSDDNGQYIGFDDQINQTQAYTQYANYSEWDIYRAPIPLLALLAPDVASDMMQSLVTDAAQDGWLPKWSVANRTRDIMFGDPADPIIASAYAFGATHFDTAAALAAMVKGATQPGSASDGYVERPYLDTYLRQGYVPAEAPWSAATTLEYTTADFSIARFAQALGRTDMAMTYMRQAQNWQTIYNPASGYVQPRLSDGEFSANFDPTSQVGFDENNAAQYTWLVPYNLRGLFAAMGGNTVAVQRLDNFFTQLNAGSNAPYEWLGNEPGLGVPWAYDFVGAPWRTQEVVHRAMGELYSVTPGGIPGNDDLGALSAWYVWAALGLYPAVPGVGGFALSTPLFPRITLHLSGGDVHIETSGASDTAFYVQGLTLNGQPYDKPWLPIASFTGGTTLQFTVGSTPNTQWGSNPADAAPSFGESEAPAIGFTNPASGTLAIAAGTQQSFSLGAQSITDTPLAVQWTADVPPGLQLNPASGSVSVDSAASATRALTIAASGSMPAGHYLIPFHLHAVTDANTTATTLPPVILAVDVAAPLTGTSISPTPIATATGPATTSTPPPPTASPTSTPSSTASPAVPASPTGALQPPATPLSQPSPTSIPSSTVTAVERAAPTNPLDAPSPLPSPATVTSPMPHAAPWPSRPRTTTARPMRGHHTPPCHVTFPFTLSAQRNGVGAVRAVVTIRAARRLVAQVTTHLVTTKVLMVRKGKRYQHFTWTVSLFQATRRVAINASGRLTDHLRITYKVSHPLQATLVVTVHVQCAAITRAAPVTIWPLRARQLRSPLLKR